MVLSTLAIREIIGELRILLSLGSKRRRLRDRIKYKLGRMKRLASATWAILYYCYYCYIPIILYVCIEKGVEKARAKTTITKRTPFSNHHLSAIIAKLVAAADAAVQAL